MTKNPAIDFEFVDVIMSLGPIRTISVGGGRVKRLDLQFFLPVTKPV